MPRAGGKGATLCILIRNGFPVPDGFVVTTDGYRGVVQAAGLGEWLLRSAESVAAGDPAALEASSREIRRRFAAVPVPEPIASAILQAYEDLGQGAVAVRSSATTEDLPDLSFAGQQETFLNIVSGQTLLEAVHRCWSSLWTARAIGYRSRHAIGHRDLAIAVVVQRMVPSESSGILFTANPVTGTRTETVVEATVGLGEVLVSGAVEPDRYFVSMPAGRIASRTIGSKRLSLRAGPEGGVTEEHEDAGATPAVTDDAIVDLARLGQRAAELLRGPQDIEWAFSGGKPWLLQSRPITSLYPLPDGVPPEPVQVFISVGAIQGMLDPFTPLGQDALRTCLPPAIARHVGFEIDPGGRWPLVVAGQRLFINATPLLRYRFSRERLRAGLALIEPGTLAALSRLPDDLRLAATPLPIAAFSLWRAARMVVRVPLNIILNLLRPSARLAHISRRADEAVAALEAERASVRTLAGGVGLLDRAFDITPRVLIPYLASGVAAGVGMLRLLHSLAGGVPGGEQLVLEATRGLPHNVTTEMDLALWRAAQDRDARGLDAFLRRYGMRGVAEIDIGRPRWREETSQLRQVMEGYRQLPPDKAPDAVFSRGAAAAEAALEHLQAELRTCRGGWWRAPVAGWTGRRMRALAGLREAPKFFIIRMMGIVRDALLAHGGPDVFFLSLPELRTLASGHRSDLTSVIPERRSAYEREKRRRRVPRVLLSTGEAFYGDEGAPAERGKGVLPGTGVSPGVVEGVVRIVLDPHAAQLAPGEILVCPGTDPAWTPLFLTAGGLVTEVGGLLTHGSVVAREYGIPAVVGVHQATTRLSEGQRVRVDGFTGHVTILP